MKRLLMLLVLIMNCYPLNGSEEKTNPEPTQAADKKVSGMEEKTNPEPTQVADEKVNSITFTPPTGWRQVDKTTLSPSILAMVVGKGSHELPPSINLAFQNESGTLKQFLRFVKDVNQADGIEWKDLGQIKTLAGNASLSQLEIRTEWGIIQEMQVIYVKDNTAYILTAGALKDEFPKFYKDFFASLRSLNFTTAK